MTTAGIDVGSASIKLAVLEDDRVRASMTERIRRREPQKIAEGLFSSALAELHLAPDDLGYVATTGEGEMVPFRTGRVEAQAMGPSWWRPRFISSAM